ncbi:hypothetical protein N9878_00875 [bacterium]|nr:hypothetical protein [bacterium]
MSVFQVEQYYVFIDGVKFTSESKHRIENWLADKGWSNYEFQGNSTLVIDDFESESEAEQAQKEIINLIN